MACFIDIGFGLLFGNDVVCDGVGGNVFGFQTAAGAGGEQEARFDGSGVETAFVVFSTRTVLVVGEVVKVLENSLSTAVYKS